MKRLRQLFRNRGVLVSSLAGGLGNQMFQYAAGLAAASSNDCTLILDTTPLGDPGLYTVRPYGLSDFRIDAARDTLSRTELRRLIRVREEDITTPFESWKGLPKGVRLSGYWQCEAYFKNHRDILLQHFSLRADPLPYVADIASKIRSTPASVSLHIRRGDYITNATAAKVHGSCSLDYYAEALALLSSKSVVDRIYVFSDDPEWVRHNLKLAAPFELIDSTRSTAAQDIWLMSLCTHHIVANSSFSWWGAWLSRGNGMTFAPKTWFLDPALNSLSIIPTSWIKL